MAIAVDAMGGDFPISVPIEGAIGAVNDYEMEIVLVGDQSQIVEELKKYSYDERKVRVVHSSQVVGMDESPSLALRQKKDSSIRAAIDLHKKGEVEAVVSAGHSGAAMATAKFVLKSISGIDRPAIATVMPGVTTSFVLLDIGANTDCKPHYLVQFALMGDAYSRCLRHVETPRIGLLNNGEESGKGNILVKETHRLLTESTLDFRGNIEGKAMFKGEVDVVVCDGFVGNISLKVAEGTFDFVQQVLKQEIKQSFLAQMSYFIGMRKPFQALKKRADYTEVGGAPLLGVQGVVIICHGNSKPHTIRNAVRHAQQCADLHLNDFISKEIQENQTLLKQAETIEIPA